MMDVRRMQVLRAVITSGSVTAAAAHLGYTPSAISQQIAALEKEAGTTLLERVGRGVRPTEAGLLLTRYTAVISEHLAEAETALADLRAGREGRLAVRYFASVGPTLLAPALARVRRDHPAVAIDPRLTDPDDAVAEVHRGDADLALVVRPPADAPRQGLHVVHLLDDPYRAVLPAGHPLAPRRVLDLADLAGEPWVRSEPPGPCLAPVTDACAAAGFSPDFAATSQDYATAQGFVAAGLGVSLVPRLGLSARHPGVVVRRIRHPEPVRAIHAVIRTGSLRQPVLRTLLDAFRQSAEAGGATPEAGGRAAPPGPSGD
ncbi:LysR family transcriptional regulator [Streptomyces filamentosus]|uniref:LysR family transcriptional regulator n=1 Tax=Streptomyces filamentosus TaxID=67294 RepID=UPI001F2B66B1|nr:LysR family transcriptional regulator [Streptomyces filamentosus]